MNANLLIATLLLLPCVLLAGEAEGKDGKRENKTADKQFPVPEGFDVKEAEERAFWARRKKLVEKQRAEAEAERKAAEAAKKPDETAPPKEAKPETPPAK